MALPFQNSAAQLAASTEAGPLVEFRAGRMKFDGRRVEADARKGLIRVVKTDDGLVHFQWMDRDSRTVEEDQIVFPEEAVFEKVGQASGRVYILKFKHDDRKFFFWMQEPAAERDGVLCAAVNSELNTADWEAVPEDDDEDDEAAGMGQSGEEDATAGTGVSAAAGGVPASGPSTSAAAPVIGRPAALGHGQVQLADLQNILSGLGQISVPTGLAPEQGHAALSLADVMRTDAILPVLQQPGVQERLAPYLPQDLRSPDAIRELIQSPQFHQQLELFSHLLQSGQVDWSQFGIDPSKYGLGVAAFLTAIDDQGTGASEGAEIAAECAKGTGAGASDDGAGVTGEGRPGEDSGPTSESKKQKTEKDGDAMDEGK